MLFIQIIDFAASICLSSFVCMSEDMRRSYRYGALPG